MRNGDLHSTQIVMQHMRCEKTHGKSSPTFKFPSIEAIFSASASGNSSGRLSHPLWRMALAETHHLVLAVPLNRAVVIHLSES